MTKILIILAMASIFGAVVLYIHRHDFYKYKRAFLWIAFLLPILLILFITALYYEDYSEMRKSRAEYTMLKEMFPKGMDKDEFLNKLKENGYLYNDRYRPWRGSYFETNTGDVVLYLKTLKWPAPTIQRIDETIGCRIALEYPVMLTFYFDKRGRFCGW